MTEGFTHEEWMLLCIHSAVSGKYDREGLMAYLRELRGKTGDSRHDRELRGMIDGALGKLAGMGDSEFSSLRLVPDLEGLLGNTGNGRGGML